jgi:gliding motility-associated-like protein
VYVTGGNGCSNVDSVIVEVQLADVIAVPNAFSPNNDGFNDFFKVLGPGIESMNIVVYNRYGQKVFESGSQEKTWDGSYKGKNLDTGVFAWYLEYKLVNGLTGIQKGNVTLIR